MGWALPEIKNDCLLVQFKHHVLSMCCVKKFGNFRRFDSGVRQITLELLVEQNYKKASIFFLPSQTIVAAATLRQ